MKIVIKIGTAAIFDFKKQKIKESIIYQLASDIKKIIKNNNEVIIVSSGAVGCGKKILGHNKQIEKKQACAAIGQIKLMSTFSKIFAKNKLEIAQFLINNDDILNNKRILNINHTYNNLVGKAIPIINENDVTSTKELLIGDNDTLAAQLTINMKFDTLIILTEIGGLKKDNQVLFNSNLFNPNDYDEMSIPQKGFGGLKTKLQSAKKITKQGRTCIIGKAGDSIIDILNNKKPATKFFL